MPDEVMDGSRPLLCKIKRSGMAIVFSRNRLSELCISRISYFFLRFPDRANNQSSMAENGRRYQEKRRTILDEWSRAYDQNTKALDAGSMLRVTNIQWMIVYPRCKSPVLGWKGKS